MGQGAQNIQWMFVLRRPERSVDGPLWGLGQRPKVLKSPTSAIFKVRLGLFFLTLFFISYLTLPNVIEEFCHTVTPMYDLIAANIVENQSLAKTRDSLIPRLMSGEIDVSNLDL